MKLEALQRQVNIELALSEQDARTVAADSEIRIVIVNMAQNAFHAMPQGGLLRVSSQTDAQHVIMDFEDTGTGIRPDDLPYIFDPFFSHRADGGRGTGLGLPICRAIVERWGGTIEVATQLDVGSRFTVRLPNADAADLL
jgi:signal transduction histidine kinase